MRFIKVLLIDKSLYVKCDDRDQITKLEDWAGKKFVFGIMPRSHRFYYVNVADGVVVRDKPERVISFGEALLHDATGPAFDSITAPGEGFPTALLKNSNIWVKCTTADQVAELSRWARPGHTCVPAAWMKEPDESYYFNVAKDEISCNPPAPMSTIIAFEDLDRRVAAKWKAGDLVTWPPMGGGKITKVSPSERIYVAFDTGIVIFNEVPSDLEKQIDWSTLPVGTKFLVSNDDRGNRYAYYFQFFAQGVPWFSDTPGPAITVRAFKSWCIAVTE